MENFKTTVLIITCKYDIGANVSYDTLKVIIINQMEVLISLFEAGIFTMVAGKLFLSQPSLTKQIQNLEAATGTQLVKRGSTGIFLTPEGQVIYGYAKRVMRLRKDAKERVIRFKDQESGHIYVSASTIPATYTLPHLLSNLKQTHPDIQVHMQMHDNEETLQIVLND